MNIVNATNARKDFFEIIRSAVNEHKVYHIQHKKSATVLMSEEDYEALIETLELLSQPGFMKSLTKSVKQAASGQTFSMQDIFGKDE